MLLFNGYERCLIREQHFVLIIFIALKSSESISVFNMQNVRQAKER